MRVRRFQDRDAPALAEIFFRAVREIASTHYSEKQVRAWAPTLPSPARFVGRAKDGRTLLVAVDASDAPIAFGDLEPDGHIDHLYCRPEYSRKGAAAAVYRELECAARIARIPRLYVEASEPAKRFFKKHNFVVEERNELEINGTVMHNWRMTKSL